MRPFIQTSAGATFYLGNPITLMFRKDYVEYIFKLDNGYYGVVNFVLQRVEQALLLLQKPCPTVVDVMTGKSGYSLVRDRNHQMRVGCPLPVSVDTSLLSIVADSRTVDKATDLLDYSLSLYHEIYEHCPFPGWKKGLQEVF